MVRLGELDRRGVVHELDDRQAAGLDATGLVRVRPARRGRWRLVPTGRVGAVRIGDLDVQVEPKIGIGRMLFLLGYAATPRFRSEDASGISKTDLWPAMGESLARMSERAVMEVSRAFALRTNTRQVAGRHDSMPVAHTCAEQRRAHPDGASA